jgi:hypothetical protein
MNSFILNQRHTVQSFHFNSQNRKFNLYDVIPIYQTSDIDKREFLKNLAGFYIEVEGTYKANNNKVYSRSRLFELGKNLTQKDPVIHFNVIIPNESFEVECIPVFYDTLNIKLVSRGTKISDLAFEVRYECQ